MYIKYKCANKEKLKKKNKQKTWILKCYVCVCNNQYIYFMSFVVEPVKLWVWSVAAASSYGSTVIVHDPISGVISNVSVVSIQQEPTTTAATAAAAACSVWTNAPTTEHHHGVVSHFITHVNLHQATQSKHSLW